jgi:hypothetical protein
MSKVMELADEIAAALADYHAEVQFIPEFRLADVSGMKAVVVPAGTGFRALSRGVLEETPCVHIGFVRKATEDDVAALLDSVQELGKSFLHRRMAGATCTGVEFDPLYSPAHLREKGLFVSVVELTFKAAG